MNPIKFLQSNRLYLRPIEERDLDHFYHHALWDQNGRRLTGTQAVFNRQGVQKWFESTQSDSSRIDLVIATQDNDQVIGDIAMLEIDQQNRSAVVRISIFDENYLGEGFGTEAMSLMIDFGFQIQNLHRIGLDVFDFNERAIRSYQKLGFKQEGIVRDALFYDGDYHDSILMGVLEGEYQKQH
ncbi:GNAT family N-acetyltransferase [Halobacillus locisalis]|uniref:GNAT family N-acetyltransferase n=1 Tax=Halobacillus locisalis TaxID=220753 RepID=A0A838CPZ8_9BACI|nr:GNAT family protein [Halobacillus locisalis]MBA2174202.1 GNAT family N-acetyltransferase [Halobacillus locisalis]